MHRLGNIERVHTFACKRYLNVPLKVPNKFVYGETGRYPLFVNSAVRCVRYWLRIIKLDFSRFPRQAYTMLFNMDENGKKCWASHVRNILFNLGFGYVWLQQGVGCERAFIALFKQRLTDIYQQQWNASVMRKDMSRFRRWQWSFTYSDTHRLSSAIHSLKLGKNGIDG